MNDFNSPADPQDLPHTTPADPNAGVSHRLTRRRFLAVGAVAASAVAAGGGIALKASSRSTHEPTAPPDEATFSIDQPLIRWSFATSTEGWQTGEDSIRAVISHDPSGWLAATGAGHVEVESARDALPQPLDWSDSRDTARRVSVTLRVEGPAESYAVSVTMCHQTSSREVETVRSAEFDVPSGRDVDVDTWWDCRGAAPSDVLSRVQGIKVDVDAGSDQVELRLKNIRQPPATAPYGPAAYGVATLFHVSPSTTSPPPVPADPYQKNVLGKLSAAATWRDTNHRAIHIGEWGWPKENRDDDAKSASDLAYADLAEQWMRQADLLAIPYTPWGESAYWAGSSTDFGSYPLANYYCGSQDSARRSAGSPKVVNALKPSAQRLENHFNAVAGIPPSVNLVGMCFVHLRDGSQYSSTNIGERGSDYFTENSDTIAYLHDRGLRMFRLPFRWDRVMRTPEGSLDPDEWGYVRAGIETILALPDTSVIVDEQSSATFWISPLPDDTSVKAQQHVVDGHDGRITIDHFVHFWDLISGDLRGIKDRLIYEITNEPHNSNPFAVKRYTQAVIDSLRSAGDDTFCLIPSNPFDNITAAFAEANQPFPWIVDPAGSRRHAYTLHHYMDLDQSGAYDLTYDESLAKFS